MDDHGYAPTRPEQHEDEYAAKSNIAIPSKNGPQRQKLVTHTSNIMGHDATKYYDK